MTVSASHTSFLQHKKHFIYYSVNALLWHRYYVAVDELTWGVSCWRRQGHKGRLWPQWEQAGWADMCTSPTTGSTRPPSPQSSSWYENAHRRRQLMRRGFTLIIAHRQLYIYIYIAHLQFINILYEDTVTTNFIHILCNIIIKVLCMLSVYTVQIYFIICLYIICHTHDVHVILFKGYI